MRALTLSLLGGFQARLAGGELLALPAKKIQALLTYLALRPGQAHWRDHLASLLWGDRADEQARKSLRQAVYVLRKTLLHTDPTSLLVVGETITLNPISVDVDAALFQQLAEEGTPKALAQAAALYQGDLVEGFGVDEAPFEEWLGAERERLREMALDVFARLLAWQSKAGQTERAIQTAARLLVLDASQESVHRALMRLYARQGRRGAALKQYQACVAALQRELGTEPEPETKQLYQNILQRRASEPRAVDDRDAGPAGDAGRPERDGRPELIVRDVPLIGRDRELARLRDALDEALRGHGRVVTIVGETGIGKSSVLMALAAEAQSRGVRLLVGRSYQTEQVLTFGPWVDALRSAHVAADVEVLEGLTAPARADLACLLPELTAAAGEAAGHPPDHRRLFESLVHFVLGLAAKEPVLIMLEDVHWADEMSGRLVAFLARRIRTSRVLLALTMRDDEPAGASVLGHALDELSSEAHFIQVALTPLTRTDTMALVQSLTKATFWAVAAGRLDEQIWHASEGNPFMVVETVRALHEGTAPPSQAALPLPERVQRVVAARLEQLSGRGRHLVSLAAIIGRGFDFSLLRHVAGLDDRETAEGVEELVRRRVLHGLGERLDFTHERIREVAYGRLLEPHRKALHILVANALEELHDGDLELHYAALIGHYRTGEVWQKVLMYLRRAGARALRLSAYREAVACFEQAREALERLPKTRDNLEAAIDVRFDLRNALMPLAEPDRIRACLEEAEELAQTLDDPRRLGWVSVYMSHYLRMAGQLTKATRLAATARSLGERRGDVLLRVGAELYLGAACLSLGEHRRAADLFRSIVTALDDDLSRQLLGHSGYPAVLARSWLALALAELGEFEEGIAWGEESIRLAETLDHPMSLAYACTRLGQLHAVKGDFDRAAQLLERGLGLTRDWEITFTAALVTGDLGHVYARLQRTAEGLALLRDAMDAYESRKVQAVKARLLVHLGEAYLLAHRFDDARACAGRSLAHTRIRGERAAEAYALRLLADVAAQRHRPDLGAAEDAYQESMIVAGKLGMRPLVAHCQRGLGALYRRVGKVHAAREHLGAAAATFRQMAMKSGLQEAEAELRRLAAVTVWVTAHLLDVAPGLIL